MATVMPARWQASTEDRASGRSGSIMAVNPRNTRFDRWSELNSAGGSSGMGPAATASDSLTQLEAKVAVVTGAAQGIGLASVDEQVTRPKEGMT